MSERLGADAARLARYGAAQFGKLPRYPFGTARPFPHLLAFAHVIDSMFNQHAKWLDTCKNHVPWRASVASQNILLTGTALSQSCPPLRRADLRRVLSLVVAQMARGSYLTAKARRS